MSSLHPDALTPTWDECQQDDFKLWAACWSHDGGFDVCRLDDYQRRGFAACIADKEPPPPLIGVFSSPESARKFLDQIAKQAAPIPSWDKCNQGEPKLWAACWSRSNGGPDVCPFEDFLRRNHAACFTGEACSWWLLGVFPSSESASHFLFNIAKLLSPEDAA